MISLEDLEHLKREYPADADELVDLQAVRITGNTPGERLDSLLEQVKNPYCYRVGNTTVRVSFSDSEECLEEKLKRYFIRLKSK